MWTNETIRELQDLVAEGLSSQDAANRLDISKGAVLRMARRLKLEWANAAYGGASRRTKAADGDAKERVILLLKRGVGIERVAKIAGVSINGVMKIRDQSGTPTNPVGGSGASRQWAVAVKASTPPRQAVTPLPRSTGVRTCEWLEGDRPPYARCAASSVLGKSWCLEHCLRVFTRVPTWGMPLNIGLLFLARYAFT